MVTVDVVGLGGTLAAITVAIVQGVKPFVELIPGLTMAQNKKVHDNLLRALQFGINLLLLIAAQAFIAGAYTGVSLPGFVLILLGQAGFSEFTYQSASSGGSPTLPPTNTTSTTTSLPVVPR